MGNTKQEETGPSVINTEGNIPPFILITLDQETGAASLSHSKILDNELISAILRSAVEQFEEKAAKEEDLEYRVH